MESQTLLAEAIKLIQETAVKASGAEGKLDIVQPPGEPKHVYLAIKPNGDFQKLETSPAPRAHTLITLDEVIRFVNESGSVEETVVWYDRNGVIVILDDATRRDTATLKLNFTPQLKLLQKLDAERPGFCQQDFRRILKLDLAGCLDSPYLLNWISDVKFASAQNSAGNLRSERESLGKDIDAQAVSGAGEMPEMVPLTVRIYDDPSLMETYGVRCQFHLEIQEKQFKLIPMPLEVHNAIELEVGYIGEKLRGSLECPVYRGRP